MNLFFPFPTLFFFLLFSPHENVSLGDYRFYVDSIDVYPQRLLLKILNKNLNITTVFISSKKYYYQYKISM